MEMVLIFDVGISQFNEILCINSINDHSIIFLINSFEVNSNKIGKNVTKIKNY